MTETQDAGRLSGSALWMLRSLEPQVRRVAEQITQRIQQSIPEPPDLSDDKLHDLVFSAVHGAMRFFVDRAVGRQASPLAVDNQFQKLGYRTAAFGGSRETIEQGLQIAIDEIWSELRVRAADNELSASALNALTEAVQEFIDHLTEQVRIGFETGTEARDRDAGVARARLLEGLLAGADMDDIELQASIAEWSVPEQLTVIAVRVGEGRVIRAAELGDVALTRPGRRPQVVVCPTDAIDDITAKLQETAPRTQFAVCWPVSPSDVPAAWRWVNRALALVRVGVIPSRRVIDCAAHRTEIWLHADSALRRQLAEELLTPLVDETENSRKILSETLLVWLESRNSAPAMAAQLGVHPQTVRYRWKRINELFGEALDKPELVMQLTLLLKASVPLWVAGDQGDFDRALERRDREGATASTTQDESGSDRASKESR